MANNKGKSRVECEGKVKFYDPNRGFGFIFQDDEGEVYFNKSQVEGFTPKTGDAVTYTLITDTGKGDYATWAEEVRLA